MASSSNQRECISQIRPTIPLFQIKIKISDQILKIAHLPRFVFSFAHLIALHGHILQIHPSFFSFFGANKIPHILKPLTFGVDISTIRAPMYVNSLRAGYYFHILWQHVLKHKSGRKQNACLRLFVAILGGREILCMDKLSLLSEYLFSNKILQPRSKRSLFPQ